MNTTVKRKSTVAIHKEYTWTEVQENAGIYAPVDSALNGESRLISFKPFTGNQAVIYVRFADNAIYAACPTTWKKYKFHKVYGEAITLEIKNES